MSRDTAVVGAATLVSRFLGLARGAVVGALFGQSWKADVLNAVFSIPFNLRKLVAEGALSTAFIPVLSTSLEAHPDGERARLLVRSMVTLQILILLPLTVLAIVFAEPIVSLLASFPDPEKHQLAVDLFRWFINYLFLVSLSAILMGVLNTHHRFAVPAISPVLFSLSVILSLVVLYPTMDIYAQIPGVLVGGVAQIAYQWVSFRRLGYSMKPMRKFWTPELRETLAKWGPALTTSGIALLNQQVSVSLAATMAEGSVSSLSNAVVFWQLPAGVLSASVITVYYPRMSRQFARGDGVGASESLDQGTKLLAFLLIPAATLLILFSQPLIGLAYQRGLFGFADTVSAGAVLALLAPGLIFSGLFTLLQRYFFASGDFRTPFRVSVLWAVSDVVVSLALMPALGVKGLAIGGSAGFFVGALALTILASRRGALRKGWQLGWFVLRILLASVPMVVGFEWLVSVTGVWWTDGLSLSSALWFVGVGLASLVLYGLSLMLLGIHPREFLSRSTRLPKESADVT